MSRKKVDISELNIEKIGGRIAYIRLLNGLSMEDFGSKIGISKSNISRLEKHNYEPSYKSIVEICKQFSVDPNWLLIGGGSPFIGDTDKICEPTVGYSDSNVIDISHTDIVRQFTDKTRAMEANQALLKLERADRSSFIEICA